MLQKSSVKGNLVGKVNVAPNTWRRIFKLSKPEWIFVFLGSLAAFANGAMQPAWALVLAEAIEVMYTCKIAIELLFDTEGDTFKHVLIQIFLMIFVLLSNVTLLFVMLIEARSFMTLSRFKSVFIDLQHFFTQKKLSDN